MVNKLTVTPMSVILGEIEFARLTATDPGLFTFALLDSQIIPAEPASNAGSAPSSPVWLKNGNLISRLLMSRLGDLAGKLKNLCKSVS